MKSNMFWKNKFKKIKKITDITNLPFYGYQFFFQNQKPFKTSFWILTLVGIFSTILGFSSTYLLSQLINQITSLNIHKIFFFYFPIYLAFKFGSEFLDFFTRKYGEALPLIYTDHIRLRFYKTIINSNFHNLLAYSKEKLNYLTELYISNTKSFLLDWV
ncbi:hypothetical protein KKA02_03915, partial [Patescibacteria group bacterium]|nr:hypothetical protein [Patescibacteria group bacterium]